MLHCENKGADYRAAGADSGFGYNCRRDSEPRLVAETVELLLNDEHIKLPGVHAITSNIVNLSLGNAPFSTIELRRIA